MNSNRKAILEKIIGLYKKVDLRGAIYSFNEVMFKCNEYYLADTKFFKLFIVDSPRSIAAHSKPEDTQLSVSCNAPGAGFHCALGSLV